jgi:hypothetical protein
VAFIPDAPLRGKDMTSSLSDWPRHIRRGFFRDFSVNYRFTDASIFHVDEQGKAF